jgi:hypothetical protein
MISKEEYISKLKTVDPDMLVPFIVSEVNSILLGVQGTSVSISVELKHDRPDAKEAIQKSADLMTQNIADVRIMLRAYEEFCEKHHFT